MASDDQRWTYGELLQRATRLASEIERVPSQVSVALASPDDCKLILGAVAAGLTGHPFVMLRDFFNSDQTTAVLRDTGASLIVADERGDVHLNTDELRRIEWTPFEDDTHRGALTLRRRLFAHDDLVCHFLTSGTTGIPEVVSKSNYSLISELFQWIIELQLTRTATLAVGIPTFHTGGFVTAAAALMCGATVHFTKGSVGAELVCKLQEHSTTHAFMTVRQIQTFNAETTNRSARVPSLRSILSLGEHLPSSHAATLRAHFSGEVLISWGNTEGLGTLEASTEVPAGLFGSCLGRPFVSDELVVLREDGERCETLEVGLIAGRSDNCLLPPDGADDFVVSDDEGCIDSDGRLVFATRRGNRFTTSDGRYVPFSVVEDAMRAIEGVDDAAAFLSDGGNAVLAIVPGDLLRADHGQSQFAALFEQLAIAVRVVRVDSIPTTTSGKIDRMNLKARVQDDL